MSPTGDRQHAAGDTLGTTCASVTRDKEMPCAVAVNVDGSGDSGHGSTVPGDHGDVTNSQLEASLHDMSLHDVSLHDVSLH